MAMSKCKECGKSISTLAKTCPGCGAPNPTGKASSSKSKTENYKPKGAIQILAAIGLVIAILWTAKGFYQAGKAGYKQVKKSTSSISKKDYKFTCEGRVLTNFAGLGLGPEHNTDELFIDEYNLRKDTKGKFILQMSETNQNLGGRPYQIFETNVGELRVTSSTINFDPKNFFTSGGNIKILNYNGAISFNSGNFSAYGVNLYKGDRITYSMNGKCYGLDQIRNYVK